MEQAGIEGINVWHLHFDGKIIAVGLAELRIAERASGGQGLFHDPPHICQIDPFRIETAASVAAEEGRKFNVSASLALPAQDGAFFQRIVIGLDNRFQIILCHNSVSSHLTFSPA